ncbi:MAG: hypothetical protein M0P64_00020 [Candidatus Pacebacteria bacterium]|jgi:hypothetical protein|nr:hypothetical protein [Candidatus Paceibacterota bacterium]
MKDKERKTRWFVEPKNAATNDGVMQELLRVCGATEDNIFYNKKDVEGEEHQVIEVPRAFITRMENGQHTLQQKFHVFVQREGSHRMKRWLFGKNEKLSRNKKVKQVAKQLTRRNAPERSD